MVEEKCGIEGCTAPAERSTSKGMCEKAGLKPADDKARRVHLCKEHYKQLKKATKDERKIESLRR